MTFGEAIEAVKVGKKIQREGWNGKGMFVFYMRGMTGQIDDFMAPAIRKLFPSGTKLATAPYLALCAVPPRGTDGKYIVPGWLASQTDILADDWSFAE